MTCFSSVGPAQRVDAAEQRVHARDEMRQRQILGEEIVGAEPQARHRVELAVARGQENDGQLGRQAAQFAAQLEAAFGFVFERDVDDREVGQPRGEGRHGVAAVRIAAHGITLAREGGGVVVADGAFVFDDGDGLLHGSCASVSDRLGRGARGHIWSLSVGERAIKASRVRPAGGREMVAQAKTRGRRHERANTGRPDICRRHSSARSRASAGAAFSSASARAATTSRTRLSRARFVYLHRRETATHWLPL